MKATRKLVKRIFSLLGYNLRIRKLVDKESRKSYEVISPFANYAPWLNCIEFIKIYEIIEQYTLVDKYRCYELWELMDQVKSIKGDILEVGVWRGGTAGLIASKAKINGMKKKVYLADTFEGVVKISKADTFYKGGEHDDTSEKIVRELLSDRLNLSNYELLTGIFPEETGKIVEDKRFCFCHIDVDVYDSAKDITNWIWDKLEIGGIIVYDDYGFNTCDGVTRFVNEERLKENRIIIYNLNGHAVEIKTG